MEPRGAAALRPAGVALAVLLAVTLAVGAAAEQAEGTGWVGRPLVDALRELSDAGLPLLFSTAVVDPEWTVVEAPRSRQPREVLREILAPHGLTVEEGPGGRLVVVASTTGDDEAVEPLHMQEARAEIVVRSTPEESGHGEPVAARQVPALEPYRDLPHLGGDAFARAALLPGAAASGDAGGVSVRGGRAEELTVVLDGLELVAPYHLREFDEALGIVPAEPLDRIELIPDLSPVEFGDRLGAVLDLTSRTPREGLQASLGLGSLFAEASAAGTFGDDDRRWLVAGRGGNYRLALEADGLHEDPRYWDAFGKADLGVTPGHTVQLRVLLAEDELSIVGDPVGGGRYDGRWQNAYAWLTHLATPAPGVSGETLVWLGRLDHDREAHGAGLGDAVFDLGDRRELELTGVKSLWRLAPIPGWRLSAGVEVRELETRIDYTAVGTGDDPPFALSPALAPEPPRRFGGVFEDHQNAAFASLANERWRGLEVEAGVRYDHLGLTDQEHFSPRLHLAWSPDGAPRSTLRAAWGRQVQSQRPYELQVEDGETAFHPAESAEYRALSWEQARAGGAAWSLGLYQRLTDDPRPRFESLFDTGVVYPELAPGRVRLAPSAARSEGADLTLRSAPGRRWSGTATWSFSSTTDRVDGRTVPRARDQTHALRLTSHLRLGRGWWLSGVWEGHTGWPTTEVSVGPAGDALVLGPVRGERLPDYHRLDLRLGRAWDLPRGRLSTWVDLQNVYDRDNLRGYEGFAVGTGPAGRPVVERQEVGWGGFLPTFGLRWTL